MDVIKLCKLLLAIMTDAHHRYRSMAIFGETDHKMAASRR